MADWSHQNRKPRGAMGKALHGGHEMLNHLGNVICVTRSTMRALSMRNYLRRDRKTGLLQLRPEFYPIFKELERSNRHGGLFRELGTDCSGVIRQNAVRVETLDFPSLRGRRFRP
jgi:hypothetical protein